MSQSLRGKFLIASSKLRDPNFFKTVVLIVEHGPDGAMGLVVNRPSSVTVSHALSGHLDLPETENLVYAGGPVEPAALFILHDASELDPSESPVLPGLYVGSSADVFETIVRAGIEDPARLRFRVYFGCAGWGPNQLEGELERSDWLTLPATLDRIFPQDPYPLWDELLAECFESNRMFPHRCDNPEWN